MNIKLRKKVSQREEKNVNFKMNNTRQIQF